MSNEKKIAIEFTHDELELAMIFQALGVIATGLAMEKDIATRDAMQVLLKKNRDLALGIAGFASRMVKDTPRWLVAIEGLQKKFDAVEGFEGVKTVDMSFMQDGKE